MTTSMSRALPIPVRPSTPPASESVAAVRRTPLYLESQQQWLFAWLHRQEGAPHASHGVLICPPVGYEQVHAHRGLRHLADALAAAGFPALRLDYHGTGDSDGSDEDPDRCRTWLTNLRDARAWLRRQLGCERISLIGLRLGALLAAQAATVEEVDSLVLWAPVLKGRSYVREMKALSLLPGSNAAPSSVTSGDLEAGGFVLTEQTARDLSLLDLFQAHPRCRRALILARDDVPEDTRLLDHFAACGIDAEQSVQAGYADMMAEPHYTRVPREAIACAIRWLRAGTPAEDRTDRESSREDAWPTHVLMPRIQRVVCPSRASPPIRERILRIRHPQGELFGILSEPCGAATGPLPFVVLINAGSSYRVGPNRLYVGLARQLTERGFSCLRLDLCGLGDSLAPDPENENDPYPATAFRDIDLTLQHLRSHFGVERIVLLGLCSGAYAAFHSAARLTNPVLVEGVLINPLTFYWRKGMSLEASPARQLRAVQECVASLRQPAKWFKFLSGRSKRRIVEVLWTFREAWRLCARSGQERAVHLPEGPADDLTSHPHQEDLSGVLERIVQAGRHLAFFFARSDPGYPLLMLQARHTVKDLCRRRAMSVHFIDDADHTFSRRASRQVLGDAIAEHLCRRYLNREE